MLFSTSNFQRGALEYAKTHGIATILVQDGKAAYETKSRFGKHELPPWYPNYDFTAHLLTWTSEGYGVQLIADDHLDALISWFAEEKSF